VRLSQVKIGSKNRVMKILLVTSILTIASFCSYAQLTSTEIRSKLANKTWVFDGLNNGEYEVHYTEEEEISYFRGEEMGRGKYHFNKRTCDYDPDKVGQNSSEVANFLITEDGGCLNIEFVSDTRFKVIGIKNIKAQGYSEGWKYFDLKE